MEDVSNTGCDSVDTKGQEGLVYQNPSEDVANQWMSNEEPVEKPNSGCKTVLKGDLDKKKCSLPGYNPPVQCAPKKKLDLTSTAVEYILAEIEVRVKRLQDKEEYRNPESYDDLEYLKAVTRYGKYRCEERLKLIEKLHQLGVVDLFKKMYLKYFYGTEKIHRILRDILVVLWNGTDSCVNMCKSIIDTGVHKQILDYLNSDFLGPDETETAKIYVIKGLLGIINNTAHLLDFSATVFRECNAVDVMKKFLKSKHAMIRCKCELILSYIMTEKQYEEMDTEDNSLKFFLTLLEEALSSPSHHSAKYGFSADEILQGLNKIAVSDSNKLKLVRFGFLKHYVTLMQPNCSTTEIYEAARGIWILAFKCADDIRQVPECLESIKRLACHSNNAIKKQALGALWILEGKDQQYSKENESDEAGGTASGTQHIFVSYQWSNQETVLKVKKILEENGYKVWMDVENMTGSILESMALAVERAAVVLICMSQKYKESPNCRTEAEYTFRLQKQFIPLRLQFKYQADGWLGALVGNRLYFDFSKEEKFERSVAGLIRELDNCRKHQTGVIVRERHEETQATIPLNVAAVTSATGGNRFGKWSTDEVMQWLKSKKLDLPLDWFVDVDGSMLMELKELHQDAPEFFFATIKSELHLSLKQIIRFVSALKNIT